MELATNLHPSAAVAIALDGALAEQVGSGASPATVRIWVNRRVLVLPAWKLRGHGPHYVVDHVGRQWPICARSSGGSAVAHGPGTLNMSLILPRHEAQPSIEDGYRLWIDTLSTALHESHGLTVEAAAVEGAFCTGSYDAVVDGRKLAGVAQARRSGSVLIHGTVLLDIDRSNYLGLIQAAERCVGLPTPREAYDPDRIVSVDELTAGVVTPGDLAQAIRQTLRTGTAEQQITSPETARAHEIAAALEAATQARV